MIALLRQLAHLGQDVLRPAGALPSPNIGHDAVGTEVVAPIHDGHPRLDLVLPHHRDTLGNGAGVVGVGEDPPPLGQQGVDILREFP